MGTEPPCSDGNDRLVEVEIEEWRKLLLQCGRADFGQRARLHIGAMPRARITLKQRKGAHGENGKAGRNGELAAHAISPLMRRAVL